MSITAQSPKAIGLLVGAWPDHWLLLFGDDPPVLAAGTSYLRTVGPIYGFFGLGMAPLRIPRRRPAAMAPGRGCSAHRHRGRRRLVGATVDRRCG